MISPSTSDVDGQLDDYFQSAWAAFSRAARIVGLESCQLTPAGHEVELHFAGPAMKPYVLPAMKHLCAAAIGTATMKVAIWDSRSTGISLPQPPWPGDAMTSRSEILALRESSGIRVAFQPGSGVLTMHDPASGRAMVWIHDARECPYWEAAAPLRSLWHWWCGQRGQQLAHGAAIGLGDRAVLLTGKGGSGKSSTALAALVRGLLYLGDDYASCELGERETLVHSLYNSAKVDNPALQRLPELADRVALPAGEDQEKAVIFTADHFPQQLRPSLPLKGIVVPRVTGGRGRLSGLKASAAFLALVPTTVFQLPGAGRDSTAFLRELVTRLPCYSLELGEDLDRNVDLLSELIRAL
jgi:hypothetical protein